MANTPDGVYDKTKPWIVNGDPGDPVKPRWQYTGPFSSNEERLTQQALAAATLPGAEIQTVVRPNLPQIRLFPEKYGYERGAVGIEDVVSMTREYVEPRTSWWSGGPASYSGADRNALGSV